MHNKIIRWFRCATWLAFALCWGSAGQTAFAAPDTQDYSLVPAMSCYSGANGIASLESALQLNASNWHPCEKNKYGVNRGYSEEAHWFRYSLENHTLDRGEYWLEIDYPLLDHIDIYLVRGLALQQHYQLGDKYAFDQRPINHRGFLVPFDPAQGVTAIYIRVQTSSAVQFDVKLWPAKAFFQQDQLKNLLLGICYGTLLIMAAYNLFVFFAIKEVTYLNYVLYVLSLLLFMGALNGLGYQYLWGSWAGINDKLVLIGISLTIFFSILFIRDFLKIYPRTHPVAGWLIQGVSVIAVALCVASVLFGYAAMIKVLIMATVLSCVLGFYVGVFRWWEGYHPARYYIYAWSMFFMGGVVMACNKLDWLPHNPFTEYALQFGSVIEAVVLSFALAVRLNDEKNKRFVAQKQALKVQRESNEMLEKRVEERTRELEQANRLLEVLSTTDGLTGLKNRRAFNDEFEKEYKRCERSNQSLAVILLDIDHFKSFNDNYGHQVGDECLIAVAQAIQSCAQRPSDIVARYGGEEFSVILPDTLEVGAMAMAEKMRNAVESLFFTVEGQHVPVTISLGLVCEVPLAGGVADALLQKADQALYESKRAGRNRVTVYSVACGETSDKNK